MIEVKVADIPSRFRHRVPYLFVLLLVTCCFTQATLSAYAQGQPPLTLEQIRKLVTIKAPDAAVAREIHERGLAFTPSREILSQLQNAGAGQATLASLRDLMPRLDEAKREIPRMLQSLYSALDQGNPSAARSVMSAELAANAAKLDAICKPFTYRAHYVENIIERPQKRFEARVRVLFKPVEERSYILWFTQAGDSFQLVDVSEPGQDWFQSRIAEADQLVRKFIYAVNASRSDVAKQCITSSLARYLNSSPALQQIRSASISQVVQNENTRIIYYKGVKIRASFRVEKPQAYADVYTFLLDHVDDQEKIVAWAKGDGRGGYQPEDPNLEYATLRRFGIQVAPPQDTGPEQASAAVQPVAATQKARVVFAFRHQHINLFARGNAIYYCWGSLAIEPDGTIQYDCAGSNDPQGRCDHVSFPPGTLDEAKMRMDGGLHLAGKGRGKFDFYGNAGDARNAFAAVQALVKR